MTTRARNAVAVYLGNTFSRVTDFPSSFYAKTFSAYKELRKVVGMIRSIWFLPLLITVSAFLTGCVTAKRAAEMSTMQLCIDFLTEGSGSRSQRVRAIELEKRGEDCTSYHEAAQIRIRANAQKEIQSRNATDALFKLGKEMHERGRPTPYPK